jgi:hypothetical protein
VLLGIPETGWVNWVLVVSSTHEVIYLSGPNWIQLPGILVHLTPVNGVGDYKTEIKSMLIRGSRGLAFTLYDGRRVRVRM